MPPSSNFSSPSEELLLSNASTLATRIFGEKGFEIYSSASDGFDIRDELAYVDKPVFIIGSRKDKVISPSAILETAEYLKTDTSVFLYSGYSHAVYDEAPDIKERIYSFFRG